MIANVQPTSYSVFDEQGVKVGRVELSPNGWWFCMVDLPSMRDCVEAFRSVSEVQEFYSTYSPKWEMRAEYE